MNVSTFIKKAVLFFPHRIRNVVRKIRTHYDGPDSPWERKELLRIMRGQSTRNYTRLVQKRLAAILRSAYRNVPYWNQFSFLKGVNRRNALEMLERLPLLTKDIIRANGSGMWRRGCTMENTGNGCTGATTGEPLRFLYDSAHEPGHQKALYEYMTGIRFEQGLDRDGKIIGLDGTRPTQEELAKGVFWVNRNDGIYGTYHFCCFYMTEENLPRYIQKLNELEPAIIRGYSNAILALARHVAKNGGMTFAPKAVYVTSEWCSKESMGFIAEAFGCPCFGQYGQSEALHFAWTSANDDEYMVSPFYGFAEVVDDCGKPVQPGEVGELCVTSLSNRNQPFIRYLTGDRVTYGGTRNGIVHIQNLQGRKSDYLVGPDNKKYYTVGWLDVHYMQCTSRIRSYQFVQDRPGECVVRLVLNTNQINSGGGMEIPPA